MDPRSPFDSGQPAGPQSPDPSAQFPGGGPGVPFTNPPPAWSVPSILSDPNPLGLRLVAGWHILLAIGFILLTLFTIMAGLLSLSAVGGGSLGDEITFYAFIFLSIALPILGCISCIVLSNALERRKPGAITRTIIFQGVLISALVLLALKVGFWLMVPGSIMIVGAILSISYLRKPATQALFRQR